MYLSMNPIHRLDSWLKDLLMEYAPQTRSDDRAQRTKSQSRAACRPDPHKHRLTH
jgi:hypothetical protein